MLKKIFLRRLAKERFQADKIYCSKVLRNFRKMPVVCIDFGAKRFATNFLSKTVPFADILGSFIETGNMGDYYNSGNEVFIKLMVIIKIGEPLELYHLRAMVAAVNKVDFDDEVGITDALTEKYSDLKQLMELKADIDKIVETNRLDGVSHDCPSGEDWDEYFSRQTNNVLFWE